MNIRLNEEEVKSIILSHFLNRLNIQQDEDDCVVFYIPMHPSQGLEVEVEISDYVV